MFGNIRYCTYARVTHSNADFLNDIFRVYC
jgi:hypothetical protein